MEPLVQIALLGFHLVTGGPPMLVAQASVLIATAAPTAKARPETVAPKMLIGLAAWTALVGNSVFGKSGDEDLFEFYAANGTFKRRIGEENTSGTWILRGQQVCFAVDEADSEGEACYDLKIKGKTAIFTDSDATETSYAVMPGNAGKL